jgi:hypothetical protein
MSDEIQKVNEEAVQKYFAGDLTVEDLTEEQVDLAADKELASLESGEDVGVKQPQEPEKIEETQAQPELVEPKEAVSTIEEDIVPFSQHEKLRDTLAQANREKQLRENAEREIARLKAEAEKSKVNNDDRDLLDDDYLRKIDKIDELEKKLLEREARDAEADEANRKTQEQLDLFGEIQKLQTDFPSLKTSENFQSIDSKFTAWQNLAKNGNVDVDKYLNDKAYRDVADSKGYKLDIAETDIPNMLTIYDTYSNYKTNKDAGYKTSLTREFKDSSTYEELMKAKYGSHQQADDDALAAKIKERSLEADIMAPGSNASAPSVEAYEAAIMEMEAITRMTVTTPAHEKRYAELEKMIEQLD